MPRAIGTRTGVNEMVTSSPPAASRFWMISGVCRCTPPTWYAVAEPATSLASRSVRRLLPAPEVPTASTATRSSGSMTPGRDARSQREGDRRDVAPGNRNPSGTRQIAALFRAHGIQDQFGKPVRPRRVVLAAVELRPGLGIGQAVVGAAVDDEHVIGQLGGELARTCRAAGRGRRRRRRTAPPAVVSCSTRCASETRCGCTAESGWPAFWFAVTTVTSNSGCEESSRSSSPPAYPLAPATATDRDMDQPSVRRVGVRLFDEHGGGDVAKVLWISAAASPRVGARDGDDGERCPGCRSASGPRFVPYWLSVARG